MLLDEPFNKLDSDLRNAMRDFVFRHIAMRGIPCLMVTHDVADVPENGRVLLLKNATVTHA
jgi:putative thiamine transport system ATP-binding protein